MKNIIIKEIIKFILFETTVILTALFLGFLLTEIESKKADIRKTELILENKYTLKLEINGKAQLSGGINGLYGEIGEEEAEKIYKNEEKYRKFMENLYIVKLGTEIKNKRRNPDYIGYIEKDNINFDDSDDIKKVKEIKNRYKGGYFYSSDADNEIKFGVSENEMKKKYGNLIEKMKNPEEIINKYGIKPNGFDINEKRIFFLKRIFLIWLLLNITALLFLKILKTKNNK
ncbi:hypothetical protein EII29_05090 [Leptotrichia sp. OH3620_COT-345]|uniref:hypothetical protein n=1 Tax=Leptotrichia sp. OH3620_COT-345 TaxID=2491048 RepID=UPI000F64CE9D|nr:hypothetical protein [Leptotrichia sp. OH3620_COT-345]RRD39898.1 hypothetical protein EII29_05090 [Leptotrichia sp. OH3620_COT-345]